MTIKSFTVTWTDGKDCSIQFEDDLSYGDFSQILKSAVNVKNIIAGQIEIDIPLYISLVLQKTIRSAPFNPNADELSKIPRKLYAKITNEILAQYPLGESLAPWATAMLGNTEQMKSLIESMPSVQANSDGTNAKLIGNPPNI